MVVATASIPTGPPWNRSIIVFKIFFNFFKLINKNYKSVAIITKTLEETEYSDGVVGFIEKSGDTMVGNLYTGTKGIASIGATGGGSITTIRENIAKTCANVL